MFVDLGCLGGPVLATNEMGRTNRWLKMNWWSLRINPFKFKYFRKITVHLRGIYGIYPKFNEEIRKMSTCNGLDLETLGSWVIMPKNLPGHWCWDLRRLTNSISARWLANRNRACSHSLATIVFWARMNILVMVKVKILLVMKWSNRVDRCISINLSNFA